MVTEIFKLNGFKQQTRKFWSIVSVFACVGLITLVSWSNVFVQDAMAMPSLAATIEMSRAESALDNVAGAGASNQIKGKVQQDIGTVKRSVGKTSGQVEGAADQLKGKVKRDISKTQSAADKAGNQLEDSSEGFVDSVKNFFGQ